VREEKMIATRSRKLAEYEKALGTWERQVSRWEAKGKTGKKPKKPAKPAVMTDAQIREKARAGIDDAVQRQIANQTYEFIPGENTGQLAGMNVADDATRQRFSDEMYATMGGPRDPYFDALQMYQYDTTPVQGEWLNSAGLVERNQGYVARPLVGLEPSRITTSTGKPARGGQALDEPGRAALNRVAAVRSVMDAQEGVGSNKFTPATGGMRAFEKTGGRLEGDPSAIKEAKAALEAAGLDTVDVGDALHVGRFDSTGADGVEIQKAAKAALEGVAAKYDYTPGRLEFDLAMPPWSNWGRNRGSGQVTRYLEEQLTAPEIHNFPQRLDAQGIPGIISAQDDVLRSTSSRTGLPLRDDVMKLREIIGKTGYTGLLDYVKKHGYKGLPAIYGLGLLPGLLEEQQAQETRAGLL
jgi:hypothetical protein